MSPSIKVAIIAVALSLAVMEAALCIVAGFKREIKDKVTGFNSHITIMPSQDDDGQIITVTKPLKQFLNTRPYIKSWSRELSIPAVFKTSDNFKGIYLKGIDNGEEFDFIARRSTVSDAADSLTDNSVIISQNAAMQLGVKKGDSILTYFFSDDIKVRKLRIGNIYNTRFENYDNLYAYCSINIPKDVIGIDGDKATILHLTTTDFDSLQIYSDRIASELKTEMDAGRISGSFDMQTAYARGIQFFQWLALLDTNVWVILILMAVVTVVTMISAMLIMMVDKVRLIGLLKSLGAGNRLIREVFILLALKVTGRGLLAGNIVILPLLWLQDKYRLIPLDPESYYIDFVPVQIQWGAVIILNIAVFLLVLTALIIPSVYVTKISPAETLKYE